MDVETYRAFLKDQEPLGERVVFYGESSRTYRESLYRRELESLTEDVKRSNELRVQSALARKRKQRDGLLKSSSSEMHAAILNRFRHVQ